MRGILPAAVTALSFAVLGSACSSGPDVVLPSGEKAASVASPIINGENDTTHQAVVAIISQQGQESGICSGTIFKVDATTKVGWILTAAHCVTTAPSVVFQGDDFLSASALRYEVLDYAADSRYTGQTDSSYDFAIVRILGVDASTPTIPLATAPDGLGSGTPVVSVGYGRTTLIASGSQDTNTIRHRVSKSLSQVGSTQIAYDMSTKGICQGDSGGPVLATIGGVEKVVGVHSYVQGDCNGFGVSGRVTAGSSFIATWLSKPGPAAGCETCDKIANSGNGECAQLTRACQADAACSAFFQCITSCGNTTDCRSSCLKKYPKAEGPFTAASTCVCAQACKAECGSGFSCRSVPKCGYKLPAGDCSTCTEGSCCTETFDCTADGTCYQCLKTSDADPACATNAKRKALATCVASKCKDACAGSGLDTGAEPTSTEETSAETAAAGPKTVTTTEGCSVAAPGVGGDGARGLFLALGLPALAAALRRSRRPRR